MRFVHTADWHLGRLFHGQHLTDDQAHVLNGFVDLVADVRPAAVLIAGDVYDRGVPPVEAVSLLNDVLDRIVRDLEVPVVLIAGNHDSPDRLAFGARLLGGHGLHIAGPPNGDPLMVPLSDDDGTVCVHAIPYADPVQTRATLGDDSIHDHEAALRALVARARGRGPTGARHILVTHAFVAGALTSDSERPLSVGGAGQVAAEVLDGFDYVALGHLHRPQSAGGAGMRYAGSLLKYSFLEAEHDKSVTIIDIDTSDRSRAPTVEQVSLAPLREVRVIEGHLRDLLNAATADPANDDYICARLLDRGALLDPIGQLRDVYPNVLAIDRGGLDVGDRRAAVADPRAKSETEHFAAFFAYCTDDDLDQTERPAFADVLGELEQQWRES
jgi:exonuclease SbcD